MRGNRPWTSWTVATAWLVAVVVVAVGLVEHPAMLADPSSALTLVVGLVPLTLSVVLARRAPGNPAGPLIAAAGSALLAAMQPTVTVLGPLEGSWMLLYLPFAILLLVVPDGRAGSRRWRVVGWTITAVVAVFIAVVAAQWAFPQAKDSLDIPGYVLLFAFMGLLIASAAAPVVRYRRSGERAQMQLRWVYLAGVSLPLTLLLCWAGYLAFGTPDLVGFGLALMYLLIPAGVTVALVRPNLFDVDRAAVATVTVASLAVVALVVLSVAGGAAGVTLFDWPPAVAIGSTAVLTVLAVVAYPWLRRFFERLLYPERGRALAALTQLASRVEFGSADPEEVQEALRTALRDPRLIVAYRPLEGGVLLDLDGHPAVATEISAPVRIRGEEIGAIISSAARVKRPAVAIALASAGLLDAVRMRAELRRATAEVEASRERILLAGYEERRRLERDLHDGAQQRLVALGMQLRVLQRTSAPDAATTATLDSAVAELSTAVAELRQIAHGVRPSALDDGLPAALADLTRLSPETIHLDVQAADVPDAVATTAYFVVSEAVTNALRHADASRIQVTVRDDDGTLCVRVDDDGNGGAALRPTGGLTGIADRVDALGGRMKVTSATARGTTVEARIPCGS